MATTETNTELGRQIVQDAKDFVLYSWSVQNAINPIAVERAEGRYFYDYDGKAYLDFASQLVNVSIGHSHPKVVQAIKDQAEKLATIGPPMATESRSRLGKLLAEVMACFGRTGRWVAEDSGDVVPDILRVAKGVNSGYVPVGAMIVREPIAAWARDKMFAGGLTYSGHPPACASGVASIEAFQDEGIVENAAAMGEVFRTELARLQEKHPSIGEVRGLGCFWGLELVKNRETREPLVPFNASGESAKPMAALMKHALDRGLYLMTHWNVVMCCPPLTITRDELDEALEILDDALTVADEFCN